MTTVELHRPNHRSLSHVAAYSVARQFPHKRDRISTATWWILLTCSSIAWVTSMYLAWSSLTSSPVAGCGGGSMFDCSHVLHSRWSSVLSIPVSIPAIATHSMIIGLLLSQPKSSRVNQLRWIAIGLGALAAGAGAVWFTGLQIFALGHLCPYCLVAHAAGLIMAGVFLWSQPLKKQTLKWVVAGATASLAILIVLQLFTDPPQSFEVIKNSQSPQELESPTQSTSESNATLFAPPESANLQSSLNQRAGDSEVAYWNAEKLRYFASALVNPASLLYGQVAAPTQTDSKARTARILSGIELSTNDWPLLGKPEAELVFVEMFDYTCPHCQRTHKSLEAARRQYGDRLAIITLPVPLDGKCNPTVNSTNAAHSEACELAKLAVAVWLIDKAEFPGFHNYLFESKPHYATAASHASAIVDKGELDQILKGPVASDYIKKHITLYQKAGAGTIPKLLFPGTTVVGAVDSGQAISQLISQNLSSVATAK